MSSTTLEKLRTEALRLSDTERAKLAHDLVQSLDAPADKGVAEAWEKELLRRLAEVDAGTAQLIDREEMSSGMRARLKHR